MGKLDITLRDAISRIPQRFVQILTGQKGKAILDNTFPAVKERKADLILQLEDGSIFHLELQTKNDKNMPFRMLEYYTLLKQKYQDKPVKQTVLFVGDGRPNMPNSLQVDNLSFSYQLIDIKTISCEELLKSDSLEDKILAVLCDVKDFEKYIKTLMEELSKLPEKERADYIRKLWITLDYRPKLMIKLNSILEERKMPLTITEEMLEKNPFFQKGKQEGLQEGLQKGLQEAVVRLHKKGRSPEEISELLDIPLDEIKKFLKLKG
ncbi:Rpn family recombination-promoting nuclease/putative transposase [Persephonella sp.]